MSSKNQKSKGNAARRHQKRNQGLPGGVKRAGAINMIANMDKFLSGNISLFEMKRREKLLHRWKCSFGRFPNDLKYVP